MALSPSRAKDFLQCPLMFRLRTVDRLPEPGSLATHKGTLVHAVLERLYDLPARERVPQAATDMLPAQWRSHQEKNPKIMDLFASSEQVDSWLEEARELLRSYFTMENPMRLEPAERELLVEVETEAGLLLRAEGGGRVALALGLGVVGRGRVALSLGGVGGSLGVRRRRAAGGGGRGVGLVAVRVARLGDGRILHMRSPCQDDDGFVVLVPC